MTSAQIAETLINGNITSAREAINGSEMPAATALTVVEDLIIAGVDPTEAIDRVLRCVAS